MRGPVLKSSLSLRNVHKLSRDCFSALQPRAQIQRHQEETKPTSDRIHILGLGNLGRLFAHGLATKPDPPPITLLLHRENLLKEWKEAGEGITLTIDGIPLTSRNYDVEVIDSQNSKSKDPISNLIVATKATKTLQALSPLKDRLSPTSTIVFTQNGMGTVEEVSSSLFPDPVSRPIYTNAVVSHGLFSTGPFASVHAGKGDVELAHLARKDYLAWMGNMNPELVLWQITHSPLLNATSQTPTRGTNVRIKKLVANATINPLSVLCDCKNGELLTPGSPSRTLARLLMVEISDVLLGGLYRGSDWTMNIDDSDVQTVQALTLFHFTLQPQELEHHIEGIAKRTAENYSSMLQDVRAGRGTEIDYINGWVVERGMEQGIDVGVNQKVIELLKSKRRLKPEEVEREFLLPGGGWEKKIDRGHFWRELSFDGPT